MNYFQLYAFAKTTQLEVIILQTYFDLTLQCQNMENFGILTHEEEEVDKYKE